MDSQVETTRQEYQATAKGVLHQFTLNALKKDHNHG